MSTKVYVIISRVFLGILGFVIGLIAPVSLMFGMDRWNKILPFFGMFDVILLLIFCLAVGTGCIFWAINRD